MPITIVVETGANVAGANSYNSVADYKGYALQRAYVIPGDDVIAANLILMNDYLEAQRTRFQGRKANKPQALQWPRCGVFIDNDKCEFPKNLIPQELVDAQCEGVNFLNGGGSFVPTQIGPFVVSEKVDVIETKYSERINTTGLPSVPAVDALLAPLFNEGGSQLRSVRI